MSNPHPTLYLGYERGAENLDVDDKGVTGYSRNRVRVHGPVKSKKVEKSKKKDRDEQKEWIDLKGETESDNVEVGDTESIRVISPPNISACVSEAKTLRKLRQLQLKYKKLAGRYHTKTLLLLSLAKQIRRYQIPTYKKLVLSDSKCLFYTGVPKKVVFLALAQYCEHLEQSTRKTYCKAKTTSTSGLAQPKRAHFAKTKDGVRVVRHLQMEDRILMTLMKLRLGLLHNDLADR